ncbi:hypothetical protein [Streptomyces antimicrobicus]|uniref:RNA polymerase sigma factor 70 region 4 type 2 domain-containing protein n=1 Tax=Streptomyces antimicrobicus TaxID=2883108 RepID=A0ABS8BEI0_9ACTN|nr:hypothetical protein [Streptomyces antimicrobicus]MCB5183047.1 hypothetical protein [Streptomyces antimicrobicus]
MRVEDPLSALRCVEAVLDSLRGRWTAVLGSECPAAAVWRDLRAETGRRIAGRTGRGGKLHAVLRDDQADIMVLHHHLSMSVDHAASLMGLTDHAARALLRGAERDLDALFES